MSKYELIVGNIGKVYDGDDRVEADRLFALYVDQSKSGVGRAGGEDVVLFEDDEIIREYTGHLKEND